MLVGEEIACVILLSLSTTLNGRLTPNSPSWINSPKSIEKSDKNIKPFLYKLSKNNDFLLIFICGLNQTGMCCVSNDLCAMSMYSQYDMKVSFQNKLLILCLDNRILIATF